jgi:hypothetical protein
MPRKPEWVHRIGQALEELEAMRAPFIDRAALEQLLAMSPRQALRVLNIFAPQAAGRNLVIGRQELIEKLKVITGTGTVQWEQRRRERVAAELDRVRTRAAARNRQLPVNLADSPAAFAHLPEGVHLEPGRLEIRFRTGDELLGRLFQLARAVADNPGEFHAAVGE